MKYYNGKKVLVTGGASGIGRAVALQLCQWGADVLITDIAGRAANEVASELGCAAHQLDVTDPDEFRSVADAFNPDILINNAGVVVTGEAKNFSYDDWKRVIDVNLYGVVNGVHAVYPGMAQRKSGQIINMASVAGLYPSAGQVSYSASKYAVVGLSHALRAEAVTCGVRVNVVCPGIIRTPMREHLTVKGIDAGRLMHLLPEGMNVDRCARQLLRGAARDHATIVITPMASALWRLHRLSPDLSIRLGEHFVKYVKR